MPCHGREDAVTIHLDSIVQSGVILLNLNKQRVNDIRAARVLQLTVQEQVYHKIPYAHLDMEFFKKGNPPFHYFSVLV